MKDMFLGSHGTETANEDELYREHILEHFKRPRNAKPLAAYSFRKRALNPLCGDEVECFVKLGNSARMIEQVSFAARGCAISCASASLLSEAVTGKSLSAAKRLKASDLQALLGIPLSSVRMKCAALPLGALQTGIAKFTHDSHA